MVKIYFQGSKVFFWNEAVHDSYIVVKGLAATMKQMHSADGKVKIKQEPEDPPPPPVP